MSGRRAAVLVLLVGCTILSGCLPRGDQETLLAWLTCGECEAAQRDSVLAVWERSSRRTVWFLGAALYDESYVPDIERRLGREYDLAADGSLSRPEFIADYLARYIQSYRTRAALALGDIGSRSARSYLEWTAADLAQLAEVRSAATAAWVASAGSAPAAIRAVVGYDEPQPDSAPVLPAPAVQVTDANGDPVAGDTVKFELGPGAGSDILADTMQRTNSSGVATLGSWEPSTTPGDHVVLASVPGTGLPQVEFIVTVAGGPASMASVAGDGQQAPAGMIVPRPLVVRVIDAAGTPVPRAEVVFAVVGGGGSVRPDRIMTNALGEAASGAWRLGSMAGSNTVEATTAGVSFVFDAAGLSGGAPALLTTAGAGQLGFAGSALLEAPEVRLVDGGGNPLADYTVVFDADRGQITRPIARTDVNGLAGAGTWIAAGPAGFSRVRAWVPGTSLETWLETRVLQPARIAIASVVSGSRQISMREADGSAAAQFTSHPAGSDEPAWSRDGGRIAFRSLRDGNREVYVMHPDGSGQTNLTQDPDDDSSPAWNPTGTRLVFSSDRAVQGSPDLYTMARDGSDVVRITSGPARDEEPDWSPTHPRIAFHTDRTGDLEIFSVVPDGTGLANLTHHGAADVTPAWSPDGQRIAFASNRDGNFEIWVMDSDGANPTRLTNASGLHLAPAWSLDGRYLFCIAQRVGDATPDLYVILADGSGSRNLSQSADSVVAVSVRP